jgi:hypothetical protein
MKRRDGASELPHSNDGCHPPQGGTPVSPPARRPAVAEFKDGSPFEIILRGVTSISTQPQWNEQNWWWGSEQTDSGRDGSHATGQTARDGEFPIPG